MNTFTTRRSSQSATKLALSLIAGAMVGTVSFQAAHAASLDAAPSLVVKYDAQSLGTESGVRTLYRRLESAARQVCPDTSSRDLAGNAAAQQCRAASVERAVRQINNPRLAEISSHSANRG